MNVAILSSGTFLARGLAIVVSPILTRLYTPVEFGTFAIFMALVSSVGSAVCGKYEVAILLPRSATEGLHVFAVSLRTALVIALASLLIVVLFRSPILAAINEHHLSGGIYLVPVALLLTGIALALNYLANRNSDYTRIASGQIINSAVVAIATVALGIMGAGFWGLLTGWIVGLAASTGYLVYRYRREFLQGLSTPADARRAVARRYKDYPLFNATSGLLDGVTVAMPTFFLSRYFTSAVVGYYSLASRIITAPLSLVAASISQVNLKHVADLVNANRDVRPYLAKVTVALGAVVLLPTLLIVMFGPAVFAIIFGEEWREAGMFIQILMPALAVQFVVSTLSSTLGATENNRVGAVWKGAAFAVTAVMLAWYAPRVEAPALFRVLVVSDIVLYVFYYVLIWHAAGNPRQLHAR